MKHIGFAVAAAASLALAACSGNTEDAVDNSQLNDTVSDVDALSEDAANDAAAAEAQALGEQQQQLEQENAAAAEDNTTNPEDADEQNVSGM